MFTTSGHHHFWARLQVHCLKCCSKNTSKCRRASPHIDTRMCFLGIGRFFSSILQRSGKSHRKLGGGSLTLLGVVPGMPAAGQPKPRAANIAQYTTLSEAQKAKLLAALERQMAASAPAAAAPVRAPGMMPTEVRGCAEPNRLKRQVLRAILRRAL